MIILAETPALERWCTENIDSAKAGDELLSIIVGLIGDEREACAALAEGPCPMSRDDAGKTINALIAARIRARLWFFLTHRK